MAQTCGRPRRADKLSLRTIHENVFWEDQDELWGASMDHWDGTAGISGTPYQLTLADAEAVNQPLSFCYIKNTGDIELQVSHTGTGGNYIMRIPAGGSAGWRGGQTSENFYADDSTKFFSDKKSDLKSL